MFPTTGQQLRLGIGGSGTSVERIQTAEVIKLMKRMSKGPFRQYVTLGGRGVDSVTKGHERETFFEQNFITHSFEKAKFLLNENCHATRGVLDNVP